jgi:hypothetical protein
MGNAFARLARRTTLATLALGLAASPVARAEEGKWERKEFLCKAPEKGCHILSCCTDVDFSLSTREKEGSSIKEVRAIADVDATPAKVFAFVTDYEHQTGNMPYVKEQAVYKRTENEVLFWTVADFPMVSMRDWVLRAKLERNFEGGKYRVSWEVADLKEAPPVKDGVVRIKVNTGSYTMEPLDGGKRTRVVYALFTDPGGSIPSFIANKANTTALPDLFAAIRKHSAP